MPSGIDPISQAVVIHGAGTVDNENTVCVFPVQFVSAQTGCLRLLTGKCLFLLPSQYLCLSCLRRVILNSCGLERDGKGQQA